MIGDIGKVVMTIFGGIITLAIVSEFVSRKSVAPQAIQAGGSALASVVAAAVNPVHTANANGNNAQAAIMPIGPAPNFAMNAFTPVS